MKTCGKTTMVQVPTSVEYSPTSLNSVRGEATDTRLEKRTHFDNAKYRIHLIDYGNGFGEVGWSFVSSGPVSKSDRGQSKSRDKNEDRSMRRARSKMRQLILSAKADHLLTLTYRQNITDFALSVKHFNAFIRKVRSALPDFIYIAVAEQQKRGAWHWHIAVRGRQDVSLLRTAWLSVVGDGNIDVNAPKLSQKDRQFLLIKYLSKYLGKGFSGGEHQLNSRRFRASHGIKIPLESLQKLDHHGSVSDFALNALRSRVGSVGHIWTSDDCSAGWACSWK